MRRLLLCSLAVVLCAPIPASADATDRPDLIWVRQQGSPANDAFLDVHATHDGQRIYVAGVTRGDMPGPNLGSNDAIVRVFRFDGSLVRAHQFGSTEADRATGIATTPCCRLDEAPAASPYYVVGRTAGGIPDATPAFAGGTDGFVRRYDADGGVAWTRQFGGPGPDRATAVDVVDGSVVVATVTYPDWPSDAKPVGGLRRYGTDGEQEWAVTLPGTHHEITAIDGRFVAGWVRGALPLQRRLGGQRDAFYGRYDLANGHLALRQFGSGRTDQATSVAAAGDHVYVAGTTTGALPGQEHAGRTDAFVTAFNWVRDEHAWTRQFGTPGDESRIGVAAYERSGGGPSHANPWQEDLFVTGSTKRALPGQRSSGGNDHFIRRYDLTGTLSWTRQLGSAANDDAAPAVAFTRRGIFTGGSTVGAMPRQRSKGARDGYLLRFQVARPDALIRPAPPEPEYGWRGDGIYNSETSSDGLHQAAYGRVPPGERRVWLVRMQNEGRRVQSATVSGCTSSNKYFRIRYRAGTTDVTDQVVAGTYATAQLATDEEATLRLVVHARPDSPRRTGICATTFTMYGRSDTVRVEFHNTNYDY
jgi:hypothetical protein